MPGSGILRHLFATMIGAAAMSHGAMAAPAPKPPAFAMCGACHKVDQGAPHGLGPNLWAIGGKVSGTTPGFKYSPALTKAKIKWDRASLINFITNPRAAVPGNRMAYAGQKDKAKAAAIADYLMSLK